MASKTMEITISLSFFATILISTLPLATVAQFDNCTDEIKSLSPCFDYIQERDKFLPPDCCDSLDDVVESKPNCLCQVLRGDEGVNRTRFSELPSVCGVRTPSFGDCYYDNTPPFFSGFSTKMLSPLLIYLLIAASCAHIFINT